MSESPLRVEREGLVETWTLDLPAERNPITGEDMVQALVDACDAANRGGEVRAVILTGAGTAFSGGGNIKAMAAGEPPFGGPPTGSRQGYRYGIQLISRALDDLDVPIIAAVNGAAVGAGCDLAVMCDLRIAAEGAFFAESFVKLGIIPGDGGAWLLPRAIGPARAAEMVLTGDRVDAETALAWGLVSQVTAPEDLLSSAQALAERIAANPPHAVRMAKKLLREGRFQTLPAHLELAAAMQAIAHTTADHHEAVTAFVEKRPPRLTGE